MLELLSMNECRFYVDDERPSVMKKWYSKSIVILIPMRNIVYLELNLLPWNSCKRRFVEIIV